MSQHQTYHWFKTNIELLYGKLRNIVFVLMQIFFFESYLPFDDQPNYDVSTGGSCNISETYVCGIVAGIKKKSIHHSGFSFAYFLHGIHEGIFPKTRHTYYTTFIGPRGSDNNVTRADRVSGVHNAARWRRLMRRRSPRTRSAGFIAVHIAPSR